MAFPFKSVVELAALGEILAIRVVLVLLHFIRSEGMPKMREQIAIIFELIPCPISMPPVVTLTDPSV